MTDLAGTALRTNGGVERATWRWAVAILTLATVVLAAYLALVLVAVWAVGSAIEAVGARDLGGLDVGGFVLEGLPGVVVGWGAGLTAAWGLVRVNALGARAAGLVSGATGVLAGIVVLSVTGVL